MPLKVLSPTQPCTPTAKRAKFLIVNGPKPSKVTFAHAYLHWTTINGTNARPRRRVRRRNFPLWWNSRTMVGPVHRYQSNFLPNHQNSCPLLAMLARFCSSINLTECGSQLLERPPWGRHHSNIRRFTTHRNDPQLERHWISGNHRSYL